MSIQQKQRKVRLLSRVPKHSEQLQISKESRIIEEELNKKLIGLVGQLQKLQMQQFNSLQTLDYKEKIQSNIRRAIEQIYQSAGNYAATFARREYYTTRTDLDTIERLAVTYNSLLLQRLSWFVFSSPEGKQISQDNIVKMTTATLTQDTMRTAIVTKTQQVLLSNRVITTAALEDEIPQNDALSQTTTNTVYVWVTSQDDRVCPICQGYEGQAWSIDDTASMPEIPDSTHPNCRCTIQLSEAEFMQ